MSRGKLNIHGGDGSRLTLLPLISGQGTLAEIILARVREGAIDFDPGLRARLTTMSEKIRQRKDARAG
jgi:hypothetical protein